jgi:hypothetical protein
MLNLALGVDRYIVSNALMCDHFSIAGESDLVILEGSKYWVEHGFCQPCNFAGPMVESNSRGPSRGQSTSIGTEESGQSVQNHHELFD